MADDNELRWLASLLWRARLAGRAEALAGAVTEWGVRFTLARDREDVAANDEDYARTVVANMREKHPDWDAVLIRRVAAVQAGEWTEAPETAKEEH